MPFVGNYVTNNRGLETTFFNTPGVVMAQLLAKAGSVTNRILVSQIQGILQNQNFCAPNSSVLTPAIGAWLDNETPAIARDYQLILYNGTMMPLNGNQPTQDAGSMLCGNGSPPTFHLTVDDAPWFVEECVDRVARAGWAQLFLDYMNTAADNLVMDAISAEADRYGWFPAGICGEAFAFSEFDNGPPLRGFLDNALCLRRPYLALEFNVFRNFDPLNQWVAPPGSELHCCIDGRFATWGEGPGLARLESIYNRGFVVSIAGADTSVPVWVWDWWRAKYSRTSRAGLLAGCQSA
jgi:hypothetical protein